MLGIDFKMSSQPFLSYSDLGGSCWISELQELCEVHNLTVTAWFEVSLGSSLAVVYRELYIKAESLCLETRELSVQF